MAAVAQREPEDFKSIIENTPVSAIGLEHEYKWAVPDGHPLHTAESEDFPFLRLIAPPQDGDVLQRLTITQSSVYLDQSWRLADGGFSLTLLLNHGPLKQLAWIVLKETIAWNSSGRRTALEVGERVDPKEAGSILQACEILPIRRTVEKLGRLLLTPYASVIQRRQKVDFGLPEGRILSLSWDHAVVRPADGGDQFTQQWLEIESNRADPGSTRLLDAWSGDLNDTLGLQPYDLTKPQAVALRLGWGGKNTR